MDEVESLIGFFINTLVFRVGLEGNPAFVKLLENVRKTAIEAYNHQDLPFEQLVEELQPERNLSHSPVFQVMFALQNAPFGSLELRGLTLTPLVQENVVARFDLVLSMEERPDGMIGVMEYDSDLFEEDTVKRMIAHFQSLLEGIAANAEQPVHELSLLTDAEKQQMLNPMERHGRPLPHRKIPAPSL